MSDKKEVELRSFEIEDLDLVLEIIDTIGIEEFSDCFKKIKIDDKDKKVDETSIGIDVGFKVVGKIIKNAKKCLAPLYELIARLSNTNIEDAKKLNLFKVSGALIKLVQKEDCKDFLELVSSLKN